MGIFFFSVMADFWPWLLGCHILSVGWRRLKKSLGNLIWPCLLCIVIPLSARDETTIRLTRMFAQMIEKIVYNKIRYLQSCVQIGMIYRVSQVFINLSIKMIILYNLFNYVVWESFYFSCHVKYFFFVLLSNIIIVSII